MVVPQLPPNVTEQVNANRDLLSMCNDDLNDIRRTESALAFFNGDWQGSTMVHWCAGCCASEEHCAQNLVLGLVQFN